MASKTENFFLKQLEPKEKVEEKPESKSLENNFFLKQIKGKPVENTWLENKAISIGKAIGKYGGKIAEASPRHAMQASLGTARGALYRTPAAIPAILADVATPGAIDQTLLEEIASERELPKTIREAIGFKSKEGESEIKYEEAKKASEDMLYKITKGEGLTGAALALPYRLAGIETAPQTDTEEATRNTTEIITSLGGPKEFAGLVVEHLPAHLKNFFKGKVDTLAKMFTGNTALPSSVQEAANKALQDLTTLQTPPSLEGRVKPSTEKLPIKPPGRTPTLGERITPGKDVGLRPQAIQQEVPAPRIQVPQPTEELPKELKGRVTPRGTRLRAVTPEMQQEIEPIGQIVSPQRFKNDEAASTTVRNIIQNNAQLAREELREAYALAENEYGNVSEIYPRLRNQMLDLRERITQSGSLNPAESAVLKEIDNILNMISTESGDLIKTPARKLIKTSDSISGRLTQEDIYGDARTLLRGVGRDLNQAALEAVNEAGGNTEAIVNADRLYAQWADKFSNDEVADFLTKKTFNPEASYKKVIGNRGNYRAVKNAIGISPQGNAAISAVDRDIVEEQLAPYIEDITKVGSKEYQKTIDNLSPLIGKERTKLISDRLETARTKHAPRRFPKRKVEVEAPKPPFKAEKKEIGKAGAVPRPTVEEKKIAASRKPPGKAAAVPRPQRNLTEQEQIVAKRLGKTPSEIFDEFDTIEGIRDIRKDLSRSENGKENYELLKQLKVRDILQSGNIEKKFTGNELYNVLNNRKNFELLSELVGEKETEAARVLAKQYGKKELSRQKFKKLGEHVLGLKFLKYIYPLL